MNAIAATIRKMIAPATAMPIIAPSEIPLWRVGVAVAEVMGLVMDTCVLENSVVFKPTAVPLAGS
jgi:hypothetical protein